MSPFTVTDYVAQIVQGDNISVYRLPAGHDGLPDRLPQSGKKTNPLCPLCLRGSILALALSSKMPSTQRASIN